MKLYNIDIVNSDYGQAAYVLGKLIAVNELGIDWVPILRNNVVHVSSVRYANLDSLDPPYEFPYTLSEIKSFVVIP